MSRAPPPPSPHECFYKSWLCGWAPSISHILKSVFSLCDVSCTTSIFSTIHLVRKLPPPLPLPCFSSEEWWLITDCSFSPLLHLCSIIRRECWSQNYSDVICFPLSVQQCGNVNWSVYLFIAFQDIICPQRIDRLCVAYRMNLKMAHSRLTHCFLW